MKDVGNIKSHVTNIAEAVEILSSPDQYRSKLTTQANTSSIDVQAW